MKNNKTKMLGNQKEQKPVTILEWQTYQKKRKMVKSVSWSHGKKTLYVYVCASASRAVFSLALMASIFNNFLTKCRFEYLGMMLDTKTANNRKYFHWLQTEVCII